jgi:hypothetical protein
MRDTYPVETAWAPRWVGDELRQVRSGAWEAQLAADRADTEARAARSRGRDDLATQHQTLAASYQAMHEAYQEREEIFAGTMQDRQAWERATAEQRHLAVAADPELRRRHPDQRLQPLRCAEPEPVTEAEHGELAFTAGEEVRDMGQWIKNLAAERQAFARQLAERQSVRIPSEDPDYGDLGRAFPDWHGPNRDAILQPPKPEIRPAPRVLQAAREQEWEAEAGT